MAVYQVPITVISLILINYYVSVALCACSLVYRVKVLNSSRIAIETFLNSLQFPLNILIARASPYNILRDASGNNNPIETIQKMSLLRAILLRLFFGAVCLLYDFFFIRTFGTNVDQRSSLDYLANGTILLFGVVCFIWAWRFGHQLKSIEAKLKSENPDLAD